MEEQRARLNILKMLKYDRNDEGYKKLGVEVLKQAYADASGFNQRNSYKNKLCKQEQRRAVSFLIGSIYFRQQLKLICDFADVDMYDLIKNSKIIWGKK